MSGRRRETRPYSFNREQDNFHRSPGDGAEINADGVCLGCSNHPVTSDPFKGLTSLPSTAARRRSALAAAGRREKGFTAQHAVAERIEQALRQARAGDPVAVWICRLMAQLETESNLRAELQAVCLTWSLSAAGAQAEALLVAGAAATDEEGLSDIPPAEWNGIAEALTAAAGWSEALTAER